jgi:ATP-dependent RNA helicase DDX49/DBP8
MVKTDVSFVNLNKPVYHDTSPKSLFELPPGLKQEYFLVTGIVKDCYLYYILTQHSNLSSMIVFVSSRNTCETIYLMLKKLKFNCTQLHSIMLQKKRIQSINSFRSGISQILIATDVASRGLDIPTVGLVVNYDIPNNAETYVHRVGRTARAGRAGLSISLIMKKDIHSILQIEEKTQTKMVECKADEDDILLDLNAALTAKQTAILYLDDNGFYDKVKRFNEHKKVPMRKKRKRKD